MKPRIRSSSLDRRLSCHGSPTLEAKVKNRGQQKGHAMTWAGNWCHYEAARRLIEEYGAVGIIEKPVIPEGWTPTGYDEWVVEWYIYRVLAMTPRDYALFVELEVEHEFENWIGTGHIDVTAIAPDFSIAVVNDLKRGYGKVDDAVENWQVAEYGALLKLKFPQLQAVILRIHQPAAPDRTTEATVKDLDALVSTVDRAVNESLTDPYTFETGKHCNYCDAIEICPTLKKAIMKEQLTKDDVDAIKAFASDEELAEVVNAGRKISYPMKRLADALKERLSVKERIGQPVTLSDGTTVTSQEVDGDREITNIDFAFTELSAKLGASIAIQAFTPSIGKMETLLHKHGGMKKTSNKPDVETAEKWIKNNLGGVIVRPKTVELAWR